MIERYSFSDVEKWTSGEQKITIELKVNDERKKLEFETNLVNDFPPIFYQLGDEQQEIDFSSGACLRLLAVTSAGINRCDHPWRRQGGGTKEGAWL